MLYIYIFIYIFIFIYLHLFPVGVCILICDALDVFALGLKCLGGHDGSTREGCKSGCKA